MPVRVEWDNKEQTTLRYDVEGQWTWNEFLEAIKQAKALMETVQHTVHFIVNPLDERSRGYLPGGTVSHVIQIYRSAPSNAGASVIIGGGDVLRTMNKISQQFYPRIAKRYRFADSLEEARSIVASLSNDQTSLTDSR